MSRKPAISPIIRAYLDLAKVAAVLKAKADLEQGLSPETMRELARLTDAANETLRKAICQAKS